MAGGSIARRRVLSALLVAAALGSPVAARADDERPAVAAASDLRFALADIAEAFTADTGQGIRLSFGSSGNLARQIRQGAPFQMYMAADEDYVLALARDGFTRGEGILYAVGRLVVIAPHGSPLKADGSLADLAAALADGRVRRFAIANPEHAPYGRRAAEALRRRGLWEAIAPKLVFGENVSQAAHFAVSGDAEGGIIAHSLALHPRVSALGSFALIPAEWHAPLRQRMVILAAAGPVAERFYDYVRQPAARALFRKHGFVLPGETG